MLCLREKESGLFCLGQKPPHERDLVQCLIANDARAWRAFQRHYEVLILRCITKVTRGFPFVCTDDVDEIYAGLLLSLVVADHKKLRLYDAEKQPLASYLGMLATRAAFDHLRSVRRRPRGEPYDEETHALVLESGAEAKADVASLRTLFRSLPLRDRTFARLYFREGRSPEEVARRMHIHVRTVYSKKHKIQSRLQGAVLAA